MNSPSGALHRFLSAQAADYEIALSELRRGHKQSHWIWYVLPQLRGLGMSAMSYEYGIVSPAEARAYLEHPILGTRLRECVSAICAHKAASAVDILGDTDALKFRSCLTLFAAVGQDSQFFQQALAQFFGGQPDHRTIQLLAAFQGEA